jgi:ribosomal-protein-alanine N-acetyltransferase
VSLPLHTERLILRRFADEDTERLLEVFGDPEVMRFVGRGVPFDRDRLVVSQARVLEHWRAHGFGPLAVAERATGRLVGEGGLQLLEGGPDVEVTYTLARAFWGLGYATEAAAAVLEWGFGELGLTRIVGVAYPDNTASQRVLQKVGMRRLGLRRCYGAELVEYVAERPAGGAAHEAPAPVG